MKRFIVLDKANIQDPNSKRIYDQNGFFEVSDNPISKVGVFPYLGKSMGIPGVEPNKIYYVYRPADSLMDKEFLQSIRLMPFIDEHEMLGDMGRPAEEYGVEGVIGEKTYFDTDTVYANLKVFSKDLQDSINAGKKELSLGYTARYERQSGIFGGQRYDFVQRELRGNHLALVSRGRMGSEVAVQDEQLSIFETEDGETMNKTKLAKALAAKRGIGFDEAMLIVNDMGIGEDMGATFDMDALKSVIKDEVASCMDAAMSDVKTMVKDALEVAVPKKGGDSGTGMDEGAELALAEKDKKIADQDAELEKLRGVALDQAAKVDLEVKNELSDRLSVAVGTFDHEKLSLDEVIGYGLDKLDLEAPAGAGLVVLNTHLKAVASSGGRFSVEDNSDADEKPSAVAAHITGEKV